MITAGVEMAISGIGPSAPPPPPTRPRDEPAPDLVEEEPAAEPLPPSAEAPAAPEAEPDPEPEIIDEKPRQKNQWEKPILDFIIDGGFVRGDNEKQSRSRLTSILNASPFFDLPFGDLELVPALAWVFAWEQIKEKHPTMKPDNRKPIVLKLWEERQDDLMSLAEKKIPPDGKDE